jgi:hypothetical protein
MSLWLILATYFGPLSDDQLLLSCSCTTILRALCRIPFYAAQRTELALARGSPVRHIKVLLPGVEPCFANREYGDVSAIPPSHFVDNL